MKQCSNIDFKKAVELSSSLKRKVFWANPFFLMQNCFLKHSLIFERQGAAKDPAVLFFPDKYHDVSQHTIGIAFDEDLPVIREQYRIDNVEDAGVEYHYSSEEWSNLHGGSFAAFRNAVNGFRKKHSFELHHSLSSSECLQLVETWALSKRAKFIENGILPDDPIAACFEDDVRESGETFRAIEALDSHSIASIRLSTFGIKISGELVGFCTLFNLADNVWVALMQKTNTQYRGVPQLLSQIGAQIVGPGQIITTGGHAQDANLRAYKDSLRPIRRRRIYTVKLAERVMIG